MNKEKIFKNHRAEPYFTFVKKGIKTVEGRLNKGKYKEIQPKDHIVVFNNEETESFEVIVIGVRNYFSFKELLEKEGLKKVLPNVETLEEGSNIYREFYSEEDEKKFGVVAIEVEVVK